MSRRTTTRPTPKAAASTAPSTPRIHPGCLIAAVIGSAPPLCPARSDGFDRVGFGVLADRFHVRGRHRFLQAGDPFAELRRRLDHDFGPHRSVAEAAELGADQL